MIFTRNQVFAGLVIFLVSLWYCTWTGNDLYVDNPLEEYDYIIVGAGTAGCVLAERLSRNPLNRVLLIEAGGEPSWMTAIPFLSPLVQNGRNDWKFRTLPQSNSSLALQNQVSAWPQGKMLGGSGQLNFLIHTIGTPGDFDLWKVPGWDSQIMEKYFRRIQNKPEVPTNASGGCQASCYASGTVRSLATDPQDSPLAKAFLDSARSLGFPVRNLNDWNREQDVWGFMMSQNVIYNGRRYGTLESYLKPAMKRKNLDVMIKSSVAKVTLNGTTCTGVVLDTHRRISATKEVILSAGAVKTPQILQLSGIGPKHLLESLNISLVKDLPVGENLQDHLQIPLYVEITAKVSNTVSKMLSIKQLWDYLVHKKGFLSTSGIEGIATLKRSPSSRYTQGMLILFNMAFVEPNLYGQIANIKPEAFQHWFPRSSNMSQEGFVLISVCLHPKSRGHVYIQSPDSTTPPEIDPRYLSHPDDIQCLVDTVRHGLELIEAQPFRDLGARAVLPDFPECPKPASKDNIDYMKCLARTIAITMYHPAGTCSMGNSTSSSVLDSSLRVRGLDGLRVADASIMPRLASGPSNSVVIAVAEKAADMILKDSP